MIPKLTVEKNRINRPQPRTHQPSLMTTEREPCLKKRVSCLGYLLSDGFDLTPVVDTCFPRTTGKCRTPEEYSTILKDAHKKVNCSLAIPFLGSVRGTKRGDLSVKNKKP